MWPILPLLPEVRLRIVREMPLLTEAIEAAVASAWAAALRQRSLFNGRVFCADTVEPGEICGHWTEYRRLIAQFADPGLFAVLQVRSLAVCGMVIGPDGVVVGRREANAAYQAGEWQLPPAGSVDHGAAVPDGASWRHAVLTELREELGVAATEVAAMRPLCLVQHPSGVLDMGIRIDTGLTADAILARHHASGDREYDQLFVAPAAEVEAQVTARGGTLVPSATAFLALEAATGPG